MSTDNSKPNAASAIATNFVIARLAGDALPSYPGEIPATAEAAYSCQDMAIAMWPEPIAGWKVGLVAPQARAGFGDERLVGPIFKGLLRPAGAGVEQCPVFAGGFAAVEAEFVFRLAQDAPDTQFEWSTAQVLPYVAGLYMGVEIASSPLATINDLGPRVIASDFGNNFGLLVGAEIPEWRSISPDDLRCQTSINGKLVGNGSAASIPGGPLTALAFAFSRCARRGYPLRAGQYVCTGATTGVHAIRVGDAATIEFHGIGAILCKAIAAQQYAIGGGT